jgi:hypothetical protein
VDFEFIIFLLELQDAPLFLDGNNIIQVPSEDMIDNPLCGSQ